MRFTVGVTGGIASGKTTAVNYLAGQGIDIVDADSVAKTVVASGSQALTAIEKHFGHNVIQNDGTLNRKYLRHIIFNDLAEKKWLEDLLHPLIDQQIVVKLQQITTPYAILVSPLLLETTQSSLVNRVLVIDTPEEAQIKRAASRDNETEEHIKAIIKTQLSPADRLKKADDTVINNGSLQALYEKLDILHSSYLIMAAKQDNNIAKKQ